MIVANLATYPPRWQSLIKVISALSPQVDRLHVVLNEYPEIPALLAAFANVVPILPAQDLKDLGKFLPDCGGADFVFLVDDDINYPADYVARTLAEMRNLPRRRMVAGYHGSIYRRPGKDKPGLAPEKIAGSRRILHFRDAVEKPLVVDQIASGTAVLQPDALPPFDYMQGAEMFSDVRLARWCYENEVMPVCLPRAEDWLTPVHHKETIYRSFTRANPAHVAKEIWAYAFKVPGRGRSPAAPVSEVLQ